MDQTAFCHTAVNALNYYYASYGAGVPLLLFRRGLGQIEMLGRRHSVGGGATHRSRSTALNQVIWACAGSVERSIGGNTSWVRKSHELVHRICKRQFKFGPGR